MPDPVYLDYAATAPLRPEARDAMLAVLSERWGNASSIHRWGREARAALEDARARFAAVIGASPAEIVFTRGGTEADNLAVLGRAGLDPSRSVACSTIEHKAVLESARSARAGSLHEIVVDGDGTIDIDQIRDIIATDPPSVLSIVWANNEVGVIQPVDEIAAICRDAGVAFHSDAVQALGKLRVRVDEVPAALLAFSAHKIGGPKGVGALFVRRGTQLTPLMHGGGQERGLRPGTEDVAGAVAFAAAAEAAEAEREEVMARIGAMRDRLEAGLRARVPGLVVNAAAAPRLPTISNVSVPGADPEMLLIGLDLEGIAASSGSACSSGAVTPSHVLTAMGVAPEIAGPSVRFSLGRETTEAEIDRVLDVFPSVAERVRF
ncbi:cysteine desulfurase family protein [Longimicrobium sp.]|uniref:cysteine desulfurase family protein n=1 Tax=Longimicrobium sp. TaxID=2029185 RepID=UPI002F94BF80